MNKNYERFKESKSINQTNEKQVTKAPEKPLQQGDPPTLEGTPIRTWVDEQGNTQIVIDPKLASLGLDKHITGTKDSEIASSILFSGVKAIESILPITRDAAGQLSNSFNIIVQSLHDFQPQDAMEARLVAQAVALYQHGMDRLGRAGRSDLISHSEAQANMAIKLLRVHNETIEALHRYRRGGEQKIIVQHVTADKAIVNNFPGGGGLPKNQGDNPCSESVAQKLDPMVISPVVNPQWQTEPDNNHQGALHFGNLS